VNKVLAGLAALLVLGALIFVVMRERAVPEPEVPVATAPAPKPVAKAEPKAEAPAEPAPAPAKKAPVARKAEPAPTAPAAPTSATLVLESDVSGASVFVDRQYVGLMLQLPDVGADEEQKRSASASRRYHAWRRAVEKLLGSSTRSP
jgi:pyruvate/2-oxoglutarate dehydrogenase complex dihydrolipoamide acyltransferase (E2) component